MDAEDTSSASSSSLSPPTSPSGDGSQQLHRLPPKRQAGRKKYRETRHPVYRGVRARAGGSRWVCEVREPQGQARIWLGTYPTPDMAARAHDVAAIALRGMRGADLNFPDSADTLPRPRTAAPEDIRCAAAQAAEMYRPSGQHGRIRTMSTPPPPLALPEAATCAGTSSGPGETTVFIDEDAIFNMPGLIDDMARGMLLTPPAIGRGLDWGAVDDEHSHMDYCTLWMD